MIEFVHGILVFQMVFSSCIFIMGLVQKDVRMWQTLFVCLSALFVASFWNL